MVSTKKFDTIEELQKVQLLATQCPVDVRMSSPDGSIMVDAKSYIGVYALDFKKPVLIISEDENFHKAIQSVGKNV